jgi:tight adherence protein B
MRRSALLSLFCALVAGVSLPAPAAAADRGVRLIEAAAEFPDRAFVLGFEKGRRLTESRLEVRENGVLVGDISLSPVGAGRGAAVVLLIDASESMAGPPIVNAMAAARAFAAQRKPSHQLAVVAFNADTETVLPFTTEQAEIDRALGRMPKIAYYTRMYEALDHAIALIREADVSAGSIVLLSDGQELGSFSSPDDAIAKSKSARIRIFSVGLRSRFYDAKTLTALARRTGGRYREASSPRALSSIFTDLGSELAREYILRYRSAAPPRKKVRVAVRIVGLPGVAVTGYSTPGPSGYELGQPFQRSFADRFWRSPLTMLLIIALTASLVGFAAVALMRPRARTLRKRMAEFVSVRPEEQRRAGGRITGRVFVGAERSLETTRWWARFKEFLELAQIRMPAIHLLMWTVVATLLAMWLLATILGSALFAAFGLAVPFGVRGWIRRKLERRRRAFAEQLPDNLQVLSSALRAGHSFVGALSVVVDDASEPARSEFRRVVADEQLGVPLEEALKAVVRRMDNDDLDQVALVAALQRRTGGSMAEVLDRVTDTIRERFELRRMVATLTAQGRLSRWVVSALPVVLLAAISALNPRYVEPLFSTTAGRVMLVFAIVMVVSGSLVIKRIVNIKL